MSTITTVQNTAAGYVAPIAVDATATPVTNFSQTLAVAQAPKTWLTTAQASHASRPNVKEFMDRSGAEFLDASEMVYGVVGSNTDVRDWAAIMASDDPLTAARQATGQMYGRTDTPPRTDATYMGSGDTVAKEGNFAVRLLKDEQDKVLDQGLKLIDAQGLLLRDAGTSPETIARSAWLFGFETQPLARLSEAAATISDDLGKAVKQASTMTPASHTPVSTSQSPELVMANENASLIGLSGIFEIPVTPQKSEPLVTAQASDQASAPTLEQSIAKATSSAFSYVDSATYLNSFFKA